jgi:hypothetical protein
MREKYKQGHRVSTRLGAFQEACAYSLTAIAGAKHILGDATLSLVGRALKVLGIINAQREFAHSALDEAVVEAQRRIDALQAKIRPPKAADESQAVAAPRKKRRSNGPAKIAIGLWSRRPAGLRGNSSSTASRL